MLKIVPLELRELNELVVKWHRHHKPVQGHRFSIGVIDTASGELVGGCSVGRPVARMGSDPKKILEITRLVTDGHKNACSILYAAAARVGRELGYERIQTFILEEEPGLSLIAAGWQLDKEKCGGRIWKHTKGPRRTDQPNGYKKRYMKVLNS